ncbi:uncharacterized protein KY384_003430 [Bacidia gigantensis]|uniref:uncharacterized protein n=1 Tax=Bacidia gigantensis TaxID=2732470 RepID=UPI001D059150|nr:uncharacterized protein KY384_003430 [Bacidia gigantensis]KAG8531794.1 hypothetical protein KY384_003430 [Bacidia gigantensis]
MAPYPLALAGYVVVGADYAGLGVGRSADGKEEICHPYGASAAQAADVVYAVQAARAAFPVLGKQWVVVGHSQGGGVAWAVAEWMARAGEEEEAMEGYLGAIPIAPLTDCLDYEERGDRRNEIVAMYAARTAEMVYGKERTGEGFSARKEIFTEEGWRRLELELDHGVFIAVLVELLKGPGMLREGWRENETLKRFVRETKVGAREVRGPMLIVQGEEDPVIQVETTARAVEEMVRLSPGAEVKFVVFKGLGHDAVLYASQRLWLGWIGERFFGSDRRGGSGGSRGEGKEGLEKVVLGMGETPRPLNAYQREPNWVIKTVTESWEIL